MSTALQEQEQIGAELEKVLVGGNLKALTPALRIQYIDNLCKSLGLNPLLQPFEYLELSGKLVLYAKKSATEQLRSLNNISLTIVGRELVDGVYVVTAQATTPKGRMDESVGAVPMPSSPTEKANAIMKAETKAKRRVTLSICGLGMLDESEMDGIKNSREAQELVQTQRIHELQQPKAIEGYTTPPEVLRELATSLEAAPDKDGGVEARQAAKDAEASAAAKQPTKPKAKKDAPAVSFDMLAAFREMKTMLHTEVGSDDLYYGVLTQAGYKKSSEIPSREEGSKVYKMLGAALNALKARNMSKAELADLRGKLADEGRFSDLCFEVGVIAAQWQSWTDDELLRMLEVLRAAVQ